MTLLTWWLLPSNYTVQALLRTRPSRGVFTTPSYEGAEDLAAYQRTQAAWLKSRQVLKSALEQPRVATLSFVREQSDPIAWLEKSLVVDSTPGPEILRVCLLGDRPEELAILINAVVEVYREQNLQETKRLKQEKVDQLQATHEEYKKTLERKRHDLGLEDSQSLAARQHSALQQLNTAETERLKKRLEMKNAQMELDSPIPDYVINELLKQDPLFQNQMAGIAKIDDDIAKIRLHAADEVKDELLKGPLEQRAEAMKSVRPQAEAQLRAKAREIISRFRSEEKVFDAEVARLRVTIAELEAARVAVVQDETNLTKIADQLHATRMEPVFPRVSVLQEAEAPQSKNQARQRVLTLLAGLGTFALMVLAVTWTEVRTRRIHAAAEVHGLGLNLLGTIPALPGLQAGSLSYSSTAEGKTYASYWQGILGESVDGIRTVLLHSAQNESLRTVMVTSAVRGEGKTSLASHLAVSLARSLRKTLLIDCDLRNPRVTGSSTCLSVPVSASFFAGRPRSPE